MHFRTTRVKVVAFKWKPWIRKWQRPNHTFESKKESVKRTYMQAVDSSISRYGMGTNPLPSRSSLATINTM